MTHSCYDSPVTNRGHKAMTKKKKKKNKKKKKKKKKKTLVQRAENLHITNACITFYKSKSPTHQHTSTTMQDHIFGFCSCV